MILVFLGINAERRLGSRTVSNEVVKLAHLNRESVDRAIIEAMENEWLIVAIIDDYTTIHSTLRPTDGKASSACSMCTIVCRIFPGIPAIPNQSIEALHCPSGIDLQESHRN